jgi:hypothetical protein
MICWLFTIEQEIEDPEPGSWEMWTEAPRLLATGEFRLRGDGLPYHPQWREDDKVIIYHPDSGRCVMRLTLTSRAEWNTLQELFWTDSIVVHFNRDGPTLEEIGVEAALQGGRHRLTAEQCAAAVRRMPKNL